MGKIARSVMTALILCAMLLLMVSADGEYSSLSDPLVSLSYVNDVLGPQIMEQVMARIEAEYVKADELTVPGGEGFTELTLGRGQTLMAGGVCEIIVVSGEAEAIVTSAANQRAGNGLSDLTAGKVAVNGETVVPNHYIVIPKADGRGLLTVSDTINILIRGEYNIAG